MEGWPNGQTNRHGGLKSHLQEPKKEFIGRFRDKTDFLLNLIYSTPHPSPQEEDLLVE